MNTTITIVTSVIACCSALATVLPKPDFGGVESSKFYKAFYAGVQFVAFNFGKAKNGS